ncbi:porin family protein [Sphingobacterium sp. SRCM116780]|nr:porin family protein [Sphingobacterium sp. SRCM116780]
MHFAFAQETHPAIQKGKWMVETNLSPISGLSTSGFSLLTNDGNTSWSIGGETGYFFQDKLAVKVGLGYISQKIGDISLGDYTVEGSTQNMFTYKAGLKYYISNVLPVQVDLGGLSQDGENALLLGGQVGYAIFVKDNIAIEPAVRYDHGLNDNATGVKAFSARVGFSLHF